MTTYSGLIGEVRLFERVKLHDLLTDDEASGLHAYVSIKRKELVFKLSTKSLIMKWLDGRPEVMKKVNNLSILKTQAAHLMEVWLGLTE